MSKITYILLVLGLFTMSCSKPIASFMLQQGKEVVPSKVEFKNKSQKAETYEWDFGDGQTSTEENPNHNYYLSGKYTVKLKAKKGNKSNVYEKEVFFKAPEKCLIAMETSMGDMLIQLYDDTPKHRDNFLKLVESNFYNDLLFHRVIKGFMIQGGDPKSKNASKKARLGSGGPGYQIDAEFNNKFIHKKGALSAARQGDNSNPEKKSSGSQFYIVQGKKVSPASLDKIAAKKGIYYSSEQKKTYETIGGTPFLDNEYTVFGEVIEGLDVIDKIAQQETLKGDRPKEDIKIINIKIIK